ncbi:dimethyladenosine transferase [Ordospora colligata]|uniref:rRNA adenine N(6)-methyltransferase n=1 Tax=Ordospora colligata OC4 TaxID=1354746 RepID=A0A0B2UFN9_9MICR|nr:dimethyladenosine transferase [Ordospora colligata OC4]KHN69896.1 dimethyladenosine transferase [Ordospora colligata OC4]TBU16066.1 dimethyladenosine transferase [Ordospora colligata]TBU18983.1 dimethyladenosine transferase [Ordospora colligata]
MVNPKFKKQHGQHILKNLGVVDTVIERARIKPTDTVLEIGGGTGNLTMKLLQKAKKVICYEIDPRLAAELVKKVNATPGMAQKFQLFVGDALKHDFPHFDLCITNLPYQISSPFVFKLLRYDFKCAFVMFQREFAERLVARPGSSSYCRLSVGVQMLAQVDHVIKVSKNSFVPPPKVESSFVRIEPKTPKPPIEFEEFDRFLKICFLRKNKTLKANFKASNLVSMIKRNEGMENTSPDEVFESVLSKAGLCGVRAAKMDVEDFLALMLEFRKVGIFF